MPTHLPYATGEWPVDGHRWAVAHLKRALATAPAQGGGPRHAYLFLGPRQIGKSTFVRAFAQALLCTGDAPPCGRCRSCTLMGRGAHPDFVVVAPLERKPADNGEGAPGDKAVAVDRRGGTLYVEQARQLIHGAQLRPLEGRRKVIHIQDAQCANDSFFNALLKTLEEPPEHVILCLTATDRSAILPTIMSRCQVMELHPLDHASMVAALTTRRQVPPARAELLARLANGRLGWAVEQHQREAVWQERTARLEQLWSLLGADRVQRLAAAEQLAARGAPLLATLELWESWWRDLLLAQAGCLAACANVDQLETIERQAALLAPEEVQAFMRTLQRIDGLLQDTTVMTRLALDTLLLRLPYIEQQPVAAGGAGAVDLPAPAHQT